MSSFEAALIEFYNGELLGETVYSALYAAAKEKDEKRKWATLMQLETETKAWLRPIIDCPWCRRGGAFGGPARGDFVGGCADGALVAAADAGHA